MGDRVPTPEQALKVARSVPRIRRNQRIVVLFVAAAFLIMALGTYVIASVLTGRTERRDIYERWHRDQQTRNAQQAKRNAAQDARNAREQKQIDDLRNELRRLQGKKPLPPAAAVPKSSTSSQAPTAVPSRLPTPGATASREAGRDVPAPAPSTVVRTSAGRTSTRTVVVPAPSSTTRGVVGGIVCTLLGCK